MPCCAAEVSDPAQGRPQGVQTVFFKSCIQEHNWFLTRESTRAGTIVDMKELGVWEPYEVKTQTIKTAIESATLLLRIDDIVSGIQKKNKMAPGQSSAPQTEDPDQVCSPP